MRHIPSLLLTPRLNRSLRPLRAGQTFGSGPYTSDGTLRNALSTLSIPCDKAAGTCTIPVFAPSVALVFLSDEALADSSPIGAEESLPGTPTASTGVPAAVMSTSNGHGGAGMQGREWLGSLLVRKR